MDKQMSFGGGLAKEVLDEVIKLATGGGAIVTGAPAANLLAALANEEYAALHPGKGQTGIFEAFNAVMAIAQDVEKVKNAAAGPPRVAAAAALEKKIDALGLMWKVGPVHPAFYTEP